MPVRLTIDLGATMGVPRRSGENAPGQILRRRSPKSIARRCPASRAAQTRAGRGVGGYRQRSSRQLRSQQCKGPLNGLEGNGDHCPEWRPSISIRPGFMGIGENSAESDYWSISTTRSVWGTTCRCPAI
jgi:hypothetical protein